MGLKKGQRKVERERGRACLSLESEQKWWDLQKNP